LSVLLLDTHAALWLDAGAKMRKAALDAIESARSHGGVLISPVTAWEIGVLVRKNRIALDLSAAAWLKRFLDQPGVRSTPLTMEAAAEASFLPEPFHGDPADRMLVATARELGAPLVTRDDAILRYAASGAVRVIAC
jgi:PIN domain nuclease of toxin-antitoxin system